MNFIFILLVVIIAECCGKPLHYSNARILSYENKLGENGMYSFSFETSDGTVREESGFIKHKGAEEILVVKGSYSFLDETGERHAVGYISDDLGYRILETPEVIPQVTSYAAPAPPKPPSATTMKIDPSVLASLIGSGVR